MIARQKSPNPCGPDTRQTYTAISKARRQPPYGDHLPYAWSDDGYIYLCSCDNPIVLRNSSIWRLGNPTLGISSHTPVVNTPIPHEWVGNDSQWGGMTEYGADGGRWVGTGMISVGGKLYFAMTRLVYPGNPDIKTFNAQIFRSEDHGQSWIPQPPAPAQAMLSPQFPNDLNNSVHFFQYGQNNTGTVHRANEFVYGFGNSGSPIPWISGLYRVLGRCRIEHMD